MSESSTMQNFDTYVMPSYGRLPISIESGEGRTCVDENGKKYIDFGSGIGTNSLGFCDEDWVNAVCTQARTLQHCSNYYHNKANGDFAKRLCSITGYQKAFFGNSGAEANECAIKLARKYSFDKYGKGRNTIITLNNSFHGRTLNTLSATGQEVFHNYFFPFVEGFEFIDANIVDDLESKIHSNVCAVMIEFVQGEGGVVPLDHEFVAKIMDICGRKDILVIADEVQTGAGRTGKFLASEHYNVKPDITTMAKGVAGGLPIGICLANQKCCDTLTAGTHGSTFGGNPIACAGGMAVLEKIANDSFMLQIEEKATFIRNKLMAISEVEGVDGLGLMIGIRLKTKSAKAILERCLDNGLLVLTAKDKVRLLPPLTITFDELEDGLRILADAMEE